MNVEFAIVSAIYIFIGAVIIVALRAMTRYFKERTGYDPDIKDAIIVFEFCVIIMLTLLVLLYDTSLTRYSQGVTYLDLQYNMTLIHLFSAIIILIITIQYLVLFKEFVTR